MLYFVNISLIALLGFHNRTDYIANNKWGILRNMFLLYIICLCEQIYLLSFQKHGRRKKHLAGKGVKL